MIARKIAQLFFAVTGWTYKNELPAEIKQCVMIAAPHTSNWDFLYTKLGFMMMGIPVKITIKDSYMRLPFGPFVRALGGVGINRSAKKEGEARPSMVQEMANLFKQYPEFVMLVTPEGTRSRVTKWKTGFYHVALAANVPIALGYVDYKRKIAGVGGIIYPTGEGEEAMRHTMQQIMAFYQTIQGKIPPNFSIDINYTPT